jgi:hypothetical protein
MTPDGNPLNTEIRKWLKYHPLTQDIELDVHGIPPSFFDLACSDDRLKQLNRQILSLPLQQQKLLDYLSRDIDPSLIIESMEYTSPELFWLDKALLVKEVDPTARQQDVLQVFAVNESLVEEVKSISDVMDQEEERAKSKKYRKWALMSLPVILLLLYFFVYPVLIKPDTTNLYDKYKSAYRVDLRSIDTLSYAGGSYYEALLLMDEENFAQSARLFEEMIQADSAFRVSSRWFLALINLHNNDIESCKEQLKAIQKEDAGFYKKVAENLYQKISR